MTAAAPKTDRELLLKLNGEIQNLAKAIHEFGVTLKDLEEKRISDLEKRLIKIENKIEQIKGGWKLLVVLWVVLGAAAGWAIKYFTR